MFSNVCVSVRISPLVSINLGITFPLTYNYFDKFRKEKNPFHFISCCIDLISSEAEHFKNVFISEAHSL